MSLFPRPVGPLWKGPTAKQLREARQRDTRTAERRNKDTVRDRDGARFCRLYAYDCQHQNDTWFTTAHLDDKKMGGDHGLRSTPDLMLRACFHHHQGGFSLHSKHIRVEFLTDRKANGPIRVWAREDTNTEDWFLVHEEGEEDVRPR
jgi:hypothetical protein